jgi:hypothetical protein
MALTALTAVPLGVWNEYQYESQHRICEVMASNAWRSDRSAEIQERERVDCLSRVGLEPYDAEARHDRLRDQIGNFNYMFVGEFGGWVDEAAWHAWTRDEDRRDARQYEEHFQLCRKRRFLAFLLPRLF